jgi:hypothetical protein
VRLAIGCIAFAAAVAGCALFSEVPENTCRSNADCFQAQGETCNMETKKCEPPPDAAVPVDAAALGEEP